MAVTAGSRVFATLAALSQIILFMENLKEYILFLNLKGTKFCEGKRRIFWNIQEY
jgi:hypothetical protein